MVNHYYDGALTQDRISLRFWWWFASDLGHGEGMNPEAPLEWALDLDNDQVTVDNTPTWREIADSLIAYRPVLLEVEAQGAPQVTHLVVVGGAAYVDQQVYQLQLLDPVAGVSWEDIADIEAVLTYVIDKQVPNIEGLQADPADPPNPHGDNEPDGVVNLDEARFGLDPNDSDSDDDGIDDLQEIINAYR